MAQQRSAVRFEASSVFHAPVSDLWGFHMRPDALDRLSPSLLGFEILDRGRGVVENSMVEMRVGRWPLRQRWSALHCAVDEGRSFTDVAVEGPMRYWVHCHAFEPVGDDRSRLTDTIWFVPPRWMPGGLGVAICRAGFKLFFAWRHAVTRRHISQSNDSGDRAWCPFRLVLQGGKS
jgi:ligand-binding SRPBCC domain-containing protein